MKTFSQFIIENVRLVHGTTVDNVDSIKKNWLQPGTSDYTKKLYDDVEPTLFMAHEKDVKRVLSSIRGQIGVKLNKHPSAVNADDIEKHGAMIVSRPSDKYGVKRKNEDGTHTDLDGNSSYDDGPPHAEAGDYWTHDDQKPTGILTGKKLVKHLTKHKLI